ncbi:MAG: NADH-quinone oxidoreductase subunit J family protein [Fidelibacterota bacterium]|jgi:NADH:ubiquinone oxidoreductase subunit 6 (subunit J)|tara:strand:- start:6384 stop:6872 length:489 start_codon:yes stop_codon:yes gene_type:complete
MADIVFWIIASITVISAAFVVLNNQLLYSAVALLITLFGVAGLYVFLWADFIAGVQLIVYIGGILVLIIFGIMLTNRISSVRLSQTNVQQGIGAVVSIWLLILISLVISKTPWLQLEAVEPISTVNNIGILLLTKYLLPFEAASLLLLGALIGAAVLSREGT